MNKSSFPSSSSHSIFSVFMYFVKKYPISFFIFFFAPVLMIIEVTIMPYTIKLIIDCMANYSGDRGEVFKQLGPLVSLYAYAWIFLFGSIRLQNWWQAYVIPKFEADIRMSSLTYVLGHSYHYFNHQLSGNIANKISDLPKSLDNIRTIISWHLISSLSVTVVTLAVLLTINTWCALVLILWIIAHLFIIIRFGRSTHKAAEVNAEDKSKLSGSIVDLFTNIASVKLFSNIPSELKYIAKQQNEEIKSNKQVILKQNKLLLGMDVPVLFMTTSILYFLIVGWQKGHVSPGDVAYVMQSVFWIMNYMWYMGQALTDLFREAGTAKQALTILNTPHDIVDIPRARTLRVTDGRIEFKQVSFGYKDHKQLFVNKDLVIDPGTKLGLVGFSGSGKTTFAHLILRLYDIQSGHVYIDGQSIQSVTQDSLHAAIAMVPQDTTLFHRTLMENIRYGKIDATDEEVKKAAEKANCCEFIEALSEGYQSMVGERGLKLSGGQRQRIAIARAILKDSKIVILDEATSAQDPITEKLIQGGLEKLFERRTTIIIAHRLSTLASVDRILVFHKGNIIEDGTHSALLKNDGYYANMWRTQSGDFLVD